MKTKVNRTKDISGITGIYLIVFSCVVSLCATDIFSHALFALWLICLLFYLGYPKQSGIYLIIYIITFVWLFYLVPIGIEFPSPMIMGMLYKFITPFIAANLLLNIPSGKVIAIFQKMPIRNVTLILIIMIRFAPTIAGEFGAVMEAMMIRGFWGDAKKMFLHPLKTLEYAIVPMIFRSIKTGDELSTAAVVKGVDNPCKKESYYSNRLGCFDYIILIISTVIGMMAIFY